MSVSTFTAIEGAALGSARAEEFAVAPDKTRAEAMRRTQILLRERALRAQRLSSGEVFARIEQEYGESKRTIIRWRSIVGAAPAAEWPALLLPKWRATSTATDVHPDAWQHLLSDFHRPQQPAFDACYRRLLEVAAQRSWGELPSLSALRRRYKREVKATVKLIRRKGVEAFEKILPTQIRDKRDLKAMQWVNADGHKFDVLVQWPMRDGSKPRITRPVILAWQDIYSGKIVSWRIDETENVDAVRLAFADMIREYCIPDRVTVDNGHAFASKQMTGGAPNRHRFRHVAHELEGVYLALGIDPHFAKPYSGRSKPIERAFKDLCEDISRHPFCAGAYTGNAPHNKPEDYGARAIPVESFIVFVDQQIEKHNARQGRKSVVCAGRSLDDAFEESFAQRIERSDLRVVTELQLQWLLKPLTAVNVPRSGQCVIRVLGNVFFHESLLELRGQTVAVRFDPNDLHAGVYVFTEGSALKPHCRAECIEATGFGDTDAARRTERARRAMVKAKKREAAAVGTVPASELSVAPTPPSSGKERRKARVVAVDFTPRHKPHADRVRKTMQNDADELALALGRAARDRLTNELGVGARK